MNPKITPDHLGRAAVVSRSLHNRRLVASGPLRLPPAGLDYLGFVAKPPLALGGVDGRAIVPRRPRRVIDAFAVPADVAFDRAPLRRLRGSDLPPLRPIFPSRLRSAIPDAEAASPSNGLKVDVSPTVFDEGPGESLTDEQRVHLHPTNRAAGQETVVVVELLASASHFFAVDEIRQSVSCFDPAFPLAAVRPLAALSDFRSVDADETDAGTAI